MAKKAALKAKAKTKAKSKPKLEHYEFVRATIDPDFTLTVRYRLKNGQVAGRHDHDESVDGWTDEEIRTVVRGLIDVEKDDPVEIEIEWN